VICIASVIAFARVESRAAEPILPTSLFRNRVFVVCSAVGLVVGFALFGALTYLPLYQQVVRGLSPTASGLQLLPVMAGLLVSSIASGQIITRSGHYKIFPIAGTAVAALGMWLLSSLDASTSTGVTAFHMLVLGLGLGLVMQVLVLATQNAVSYEQLGVATSGATLFRSIGGSLGTAVLGAIFSAHLTSGLRAGKPRPEAFTDAIDLVFVVATIVTAVAFVLAWFIQERPLRRTVESNAGLGEAFCAPVDTDSLREVVRGLSRLVGRERTLEFIDNATKKAGVDVPAPVGWVVLRQPTPDELAEIRALPQVDANALDAAVDDARLRGLYDGGSLTQRGQNLRERLVVARTQGLRDLIADWEPERDPELDPLLERLAEELGYSPEKVSMERELVRP
jgi:hypothetical protein